MFSDSLLSKWFVFGIAVICCMNGLINSVNSVACGTVGESCDVDIIFVMDGSGSVGFTGWGQEVTFVNSVIDSLGFPSNVGIIEFDSSLTTIYGLCSSQSDCDTIHSALNAYTFNGGGTNIPLGVQAGIDMFNAGCDDLSKPNIMVVITDGFGGNPCALDLTGIQTYLVKVGAGIGNTAIDCIVDNINTDIFEVDSFDDIEDFVEELADTVCNGGSCELDFEYCENDPCSCDEATNCQVCNDPSGCAQCANGFFKHTYNTQCYECQEMFGDECLFCQDFNGCGQCDTGYERVYLEECGLWGCNPTGPEIKCDEDIIIAIDESASLNDAQFELELDFAGDLVDLIEDESDIGVLMFGTMARLGYVLGSGDATAVKAAISAEMRDEANDGSTNYVDVINDAITMFDTYGTNDKPDVLVILSDGLHNAGGDPCSIDISGITIVIVGFGPNFDENDADITCLVDDPKQIITSEEFTHAALESILLDVAFEVCDYVCPNGATDSSPDLDVLTGCPLPCDEFNPNNSCQCDELCFCHICHSPEGCDQCLPGYFKKGYNYPCVACDESIFGENCLFCQDFHGCGQCEDGYTRVFDTTCQLWKCQ